MSNLNMLNSHRYKVNQINLWRENFKIDYGYIDFYDEYSDTIINKIYDLITNDKIDDSKSKHNLVVFLCSKQVKQKILFNLFIT